MSGEDPANYRRFPDGAPIRHSVRNAGQLGEDFLRSQQAAAAAPPQMQQVIHQHGAEGQAHQMQAAAAEEQARREFLQAIFQANNHMNPMRAQQQNQQVAQQAADYAVPMNQPRQQQVLHQLMYRPQQPQAPAAFYQAHVQQNPQQQAVQQQWFAGDDAQAVHPANQRQQANQYAQAQHMQQMQLDLLRAQQAQQAAMAAQQAAQAARAAAAQLAQAPNVHVHVVAGPQQLGVDMAAREARAEVVARAVHAAVHAQPVYQVQMPAHNHGVFMMRAQQPAGPHETPDVRAARIKAEREANEEAENLARRYSRGCFICTNPNPLRRAVLVACGHIICSPCAEEAKGSACHLKCPFCRKPSSFVKIFEDEAKEEQLQQEQQQLQQPSRHDGDGMDESESSSEPVQG